MAQRIVQRAALPLHFGAAALDLVALAAQRFQLAVDAPDRLLGLLDFARARKQARHARLHAAAGHRAAGVHHVALERDQPELIAPGALDGDAGVEVLGDDRAPEQVVHHAAVLRVVADQLRREADAARHRQHLPLLRGERAPAHGRDRQKRRPPEAVLAQVFDHALGVLVAVDDDVLQRAAEHHVDRALELFGHVDQVGDDTRSRVVRQAARLHEHLLDGIVVAFVVALHLAQQLQPRIALLALRLHGAEPLGRLRRALARALELGGKRLEAVGDFLLPGALRVQTALRVAHLLAERVPRPACSRARSLSMPPSRSSSADCIAESRARWLRTSPKRFIA